jgi:hypothetical protein
MIFVQAKDCTEKWIKIDVDLVVKRISSILQFTASDGFKPSFDILAAMATSCASISCLREVVRKFKQDVAVWVEARLEALQQFVDSDGNLKIPICLAQHDELTRRLVLGILYAVRHRYIMPIIIDDALAYITNVSYKEAFNAMMRPYMITVNYYMDVKELLMFNPIIITPGGTALYRLARPNKYVILMDHLRWELDRRIIEKIAYS